MELTTIEQINQLASQQLTAEEIMILKLRLTLEPPDIALSMQMSRQGVHQAINRALAKVALQTDK